MRDRRARLVFVVLILAFPALMIVASPRPSSAREAALPLLAVEGVLIGGLTAVARERRRLLAGQSGASPRALPGRPVGRSRKSAAVGRAAVGR
jgi:hypothetical protein